MRLVHVRRREKRDKNILRINMDLRINIHMSGDRVQKSFWPKRTINKDVFFAECF